MVDQAKLQALLDKEDIREILYRYCRACDRADRALLESCYHPGAIEDHGAFFGEASDFAANLVTNAARLYQRMGHMVSTINIALDGDVAHSEAYVCAGGPLVAPAAGDGTQVRVIYGRYIDRFERRHGEWRIAARTVVYDWIEERERAELALGDDALFGVRKPVGCAAPGDAVYALLRDVRGGEGSGSAT